MEIPLAIEMENLGRIYRSYQKNEGIKESLKGLFNRQYVDKVAVTPTTLKIPQGKIVGLIGANGAGKTTLLKMLSGLVTPTSGKALVLGYEPHKRDYRFLAQISILLGQKNQLWWDLSPVDSYALLARIYDLEPSQAIKKVEELATLLQCTHVLNTQLRRLSLGERMKMEIIGALLHDPKILFLDEPTIGLDLVAQESIRQFLFSYVKEKSPTVILTSHYMDDISTLADVLLLMSKGSIVYHGTVDQFVKESNAKKCAENLTSEEVDFEEVIRRFLKAESGL